MKTFKDIINEVAEPKGGDEKRFKAKHVVAKYDHPAAEDEQFTAKDVKKDKTKKASYKDDKDEEVYEEADVHTKRADKKAVIVHDVDSEGKSKTSVRKQRAGEIKVEGYVSDAQRKAVHASKDEQKKKKKTYKEIFSGQDLAEDPWEEVPMMARQMEFICEAAEDIKEYVMSGIDPEEWFQNKVAHVHGQMQGLYAYVEGDERMKSAKMADMNPMGEEVELDEGAKNYFVYQKGVPKTKEVTHRGTEQSSKDWIRKNAKHYGHKGKDFVIYKGKYPNVKPSDALDFKYVAEEVELNEAFKMGSMKLKDGSSVKLSKEEAEAVNELFSELNSSNKKRMEEEMMKDKSGFDKVLKFAKEAM